MPYKDKNKDKEYKRNWAHKNKEKRRKPKILREIICPNCKNPFTTFNKNQDFCSKECRQNYNSEKIRKVKALKEKIYKTTLCPFCNKEFLQKHLSQKYCSEKCRARNWKKSNRERIKNYTINTMLGSTKQDVIDYFNLVNNTNRKDVRIKVQKRLYPTDNKCEICGKEAKRLVYHHWLIKNDKAYGLWVCGKCHWVAEVIEQKLYDNYAQKYIDLKEKINKEY